MKNIKYERFLFYLTLYFLLGLFLPEVHAEDEKWVLNPDLQTTYYFDSRDYNTLNVQSSVDLPLGFDLWGFTDIHGNQNDADKRFAFKRSFMEYRLRRDFDPDGMFGIKGLGFEIEYNGFNGTDTTALRYGLIFKHGLPLPFDGTSWLQWRYHPVETFERGQQASVIYRLGFTPKLYISGFADYNFDLAGKPQWVLEPQLNYVLNKWVDLVVELRYNGFEAANSKLQGFGVAPGLKFKF